MVWFQTQNSNWCGFKRMVCFPFQHFDKRSEIETHETDSPIISHRSVGTATETETATAAASASNVLVEQMQEIKKMIGLQEPQPPPLAQIKKIMKADEDVRMISVERLI